MHMASEICWARRFVGLGNPRHQGSAYLGLDLADFLLKCFDLVPQSQVAVGFCLAEAFQRRERQGDFVIECINGVPQLSLNRPREILALFIHLIPILPKDLFSSPDGIDRAGQGRDPGDGAGDVKQRCVGEGGDYRGDPAGCHHAARYS